MVRGLKPEESGGRGAQRNPRDFYHLCHKADNVSSPCGSSGVRGGVKEIWESTDVKSNGPISSNTNDSCKSHSEIVLKRVMNQVLISWIYLLALCL